MIQVFNHSGVPDWNRTNDLSLRRRSLYPTELQGPNTNITQKGYICNLYFLKLMDNINHILNAVFNL